MSNNRPFIQKIISKSWIGFLLASIMFIWGTYFSIFLLLFAGILLFYLSFRHGASAIKSDDEVEKWNLDYEGRLFIIFASKQKTQDYIRRHIIPKEATKLIQLFYDGPKIVTQEGPIDKYHLGAIYRDNDFVRIYRFSEGRLKQIENFGPASEIEQNSESVRERILEIYNIFQMK